MTVSGRFVVLVLSLLMFVALAAPRQASLAQSATPSGSTVQAPACGGSGCTCPLPVLTAGVTMYDLGTQTVSGTTWSFSGDYCTGVAAWETVTVSNFGWCFSGPNDPRAGTAHAGAAFWYAELTPMLPTSAGYTYTGNLVPKGEQSGSNVTGSITVTTSPDFSTTHVSASLAGSDLSFFQANSLQVCLLGSS